METQRHGQTPASLQDFWAWVLTDELVRQGVHHFVAGGGSRSTPLVAAVLQRKDIRLWTHPDERSAAFFALGLARASGRPAAVITTSGSAIGHLVPAVMEAHESGIPLILLTADRPPEQQGVGAPQTTRQIPLHPHLRAFWNAGPPEPLDRRVAHLRVLVHQAVQQSLGVPPGPVQINLPFRKPLEPHRDPAFSPPRDTFRPPGAVQRHLHPDPTLLQELRKRILETEEGMILVGADPLTDRDRDAVLAFARTVGYPILADPASGLRTRGSCKEGLLSGYVFFLRTPRTRQALLQTRIWIQIGRLPTASEWQDFLPHASGMHVLVDPYGRWLDFLPRTHHLLWGSLPDLLTGLTEAIPPRRGAWWRRWTDAGCRFEQALQGCLAGHPHLDEVSTVYLLQRALPAYGFLYVASSLPIRELERYLLAQPIHRPVMAHRALNGIDGTLSIAAGISAHRGEPGLVFTGDLAFLHDLNGMLWGTRNGIALTVVVLNNRGGGIFHTLPVEADARLREVLATPHQADIPALARGYGADVHTATDRATLQTLLQDPPNRGIRVVVVPVARETYPERLHRWLARGRQLLEHLI